VLLNNKINAKNILNVSCKIKQKTKFHEGSILVSKVEVTSTHLVAHVAFVNCKRWDKDKNYKMLLDGILTISQVSTHTLI
jgi:hypothetical protein